MQRTSDPLPGPDASAGALPARETAGADLAPRGQAAVLAAAFEGEDAQTDLTDALANVMHYARLAGLDFEQATEDARTQFDAETQ